MAEEKGLAPERDMLDIIFANRNKAYGAYQLRRSYSQYLGRALGFGLLLIGLFFALPFILSAVRGLVPKEKPIDVVAELGPPPDIDPNNPPPPPPPPPPTPPPPTRSTVKFVPPVIKKDEEVQDEKPPAVEELIEKKEDIGTEDKKGNDEAAPAIDENPSELQIIEEPKVVEEKTYELFDIQKPPSFPGGEGELMKFLSKNIEYPTLAKENNIQGVVALTFVVGKDGSVSDVQVVKDIGGGCGKEAVRVVKAMPKWVAGEANGNPVKVRFTLPVRFRLD
ncbi:MAG TPA: TonB family protein [Saprospiraceae bacterium]|nr:TonB family protein [Saprospiraceae bacterium]HPI07229.1 TonB family protein [Saprospiraceae bacterium]